MRAENPNAQVLVRAIAFSDGARWHIAQPEPVDEFRWNDLKAGGVTDMGQALKMLAEQLHPDVMPPRALPPVLVLISDGQPTDNFDAGLKALLAEPWGKKAVRIAIAIGQDADHNVLQKFIANPEFQPLQANNADSLVRYIRWASTEVLKSASSPASQILDETGVPAHGKRAAPGSARIVSTGRRATCGRSTIRRLACAGCVAHVSNSADNEIVAFPHCGASLAPPCAAQSMPAAARPTRTPSPGTHRA